MAGDSWIFDHIYVFKQLLPDIQKKKLKLAKTN